MVQFLHIGRNSCVKNPRKVWKPIYQGVNSNGLWVLALFNFFSFCLLTQLSLEQGGG